MKKNKMMRLASALLVAVLLTTCGISGTFAKYVTTAEGFDTARVAKWGVGINPNGELFLKEYAKTDDTYTLTGNTVESSDDWKLVAPGTDGSISKVALTGTPEVAVRVSYSATLTLTNWTTGGSDAYCPLIFTVNGKTHGITGNSKNPLDYGYASIPELKAGVENAINTYSRDYEPNTNLDTTAVSNENLDVRWQWDFHVSDANDVKDTALGNRALEEATRPVVRLDIKTTVTQID